MMRTRCLCLLGVLVAINPLVAQGADKLQDLVASAKAGQTIDLPAGEFVGGVTLPEGVSLKGAGYDKTIIEAKGCDSGIVVKGGKGVVISGLTVRGAAGTNVVVRGGENIVVQNVRATGGSSGFLMSGVKNGRIENCVSDRNSFGIVVGGGSDCAVVNCTVAACSEMGISLAACPSAVAFNNCVVGSAVCLNIDKPSNVRVDHNLYFGMFVGQMKDQIGKRMLTAWQYLTGLDAHSVQMPVEFANVDAGDFAPASILPWAMDRAVTAQWGAAEFAGVKAPQTDMLGNPRTARPGVGAVETSVKAPRSADGQFTVTSDAGLKSAGVFTKDGMLVTYLFQNLPLPEGQHSFWLPARDYVGKAIPAGEYEVRLAQSDFKWKYQNHVGDNGADTPAALGASFNPEFVAFAPNGILVMQQGPSEDHTGVRGYDTVTGKVRWYMHGGPEAQGVAVGKDGIVYVLGGWNAAKSESRLTRLDSATGKVIPFPDSKVGHTYPITSPKPSSLAALGDRLYSADAMANKLTVLKMADGKVEKTITVPSPSYVTGDDKNNVLWVISGQSLLALAPDGTKVSEFIAVPDPAAVTASNGRLAVASHKTGKVHFFDARDPKNLKPAAREVGKGDGPFGAFATDRFFFQKGGAWGVQEAHDAKASIALDSSGQLAVVDRRRVLMFDGDGKNLWWTIGVFGNPSKPSFSTQNRRLWDTFGTFSFMMDETTGTWEPEALLDHSLVLPEGLNEAQLPPLGDFSDSGKTFLVFAGGGNAFAQMVVARLDGFKSVPVLVVGSENKVAVMREDTNGDGKITADDTAKPLVDAQGNPVPAAIFPRFVYMEADGSITMMTNPPRIWKRTGLNANGVPVYDGKNLVSMPSKDWDKDINPYDFKAPGGLSDQWCGFTVTGMLSDGGYIGQVSLRSSGGTGLNNGAGTDLMGFGPDGRRRWVHQLKQHKGIAGMGTVDDITVTTVYYSVEKIVVDGDGLALGGFCEAPQLRYGGYWVDCPNLRLFKMPDGHLHVTVGSNADGRHMWYRLDNQESLKKTTEVFGVSQARAAELAALEWKPATPAGRPPQPQIRIPRLAAPLKIDGELEKWRNAGIKPVIVMGPSGRVNGPSDLSGIIRMAYEGQNLYFQVLQFDDVTTFHQRDNMYQQDAVELAINATYPNGFQFIAYKDPNGQDLIHRHRFMQGEIPPIKLRPEHAPRIVRVLDNAKDVTEREILEGLYGEDMSKAKVIVTEFMLPMDKETYVQAEADIVELGPGKSFWIGFFLDDNDEPYTDVQGFIVWPSTFGMFNPKEEGAIAVCE